MEKKATYADRREKILEIATMLFYQEGYDNTSIRELSQAVELSVAGVYYFFKDKEEILFSILNQAIINLTTNIRNSIDEKDDPEQNIRRIIKNLLGHAINHKMEIYILNREDGRLSTEQKETIYKHRQIAYSLIKSELVKLTKREAAESENYSVAIFAIFSMTTWFVRWYDPKGTLTLEEIAEEMVDLFFNGYSFNR